MDSRPLRARFKPCRTIWLLCRPMAIRCSQYCARCRPRGERVVYFPRRTWRMLSRAYQYLRPPVVSKTRGTKKCAWVYMAKPISQCWVVIFLFSRRRHAAQSRSSAHMNDGLPLCHRRLKPNSAQSMGCALEALILRVGSLKSEEPRVGSFVLGNTLLLAVFA